MTPSHLDIRVRVTVRAECFAIEQLQKLARSKQYKSSKNLILSLSDNLIIGY